MLRFDSVVLNEYYYYYYYCYWYFASASCLVSNNSLLFFFREMSHIEQIALSDVVIVFVGVWRMP